MLDNTPLPQIFFEYDIWEWTLLLIASHVVISLTDLGCHIVTMMQA